MGALFAGPISGASMNPARSLAPAILSGEVGALWVYVLAPLAGAGIAVGMHSLLDQRLICREHQTHTDPTRNSLTQPAGE